MTGAFALVFEQLSHDFPHNAIRWVTDSGWVGPKLVELKDIDFSDSDKWRASGEPEKVERFVEKVAQGRMKPLVGVVGPRGIRIVDGHHRALAYQKLGRAALMYVAQPRDADVFRLALEMHSHQKENPSQMSDLATPFDAELAQFDLGTGSVQTPGAKKSKRQKKSSAKQPQQMPLPAPAVAPKARSKGTRVSAKLGKGGSLYVRPMTEWAPSVMLAAAGDDGPVWIQLAKTGTFRGHRQGSFSMTAGTFREIIKNFKATANGRIPVDYEHASEQDPTSGSIPFAGAPAQGWIVDMAIRGDDLWGRVEWNAQAKQQIRAKEYMFFSPAIRFAAKDRVSGDTIGAVMTSGALTNKPFLDGMMPLAARDDGGEFEAEFDEDGELTQLTAMAFSADEFLPKLRACLKIQGLATPEECAIQVHRLRSLLARAGGDHAAIVDGVELTDYLAPMRDLVGAHLGMTWGDVFDTVDRNIAVAMGDTEEIDPEDEQPSDPNANPDNVGGSGDTEMTMSDAEKAHLANIEEQNRSLTTKVNELTVALSAKDADVKTLTDENVALKKSEGDRAAQEMSDRIEYTKKAHSEKLKALPGDDAAKTKLLTDLFSNSRSFFDAQYPIVQVEDKRGDLPRPAMLLSGAPIVQPERKPDPESVLVDVKNETWGQTVTRLMNDGDLADKKPLPYGAACDRARTLRRAAGLSVA